MSAEPLVSCLQFMVEDRMACGTSGAVRYSTRWVESIGWVCLGTIYGS